MVVIGVLVEGFLVRNNSWTLLGSQLAKDKKKGYYVIPGGPVEIRPGDVVAARCLYINRGTEPIGFGMSGGEEMCNFQLDIGFRPEDADHFRRPAMCTAESPTFRFCDHEETAAIC
ncbi:peptidyl-glycine alpha-amidating monooxygenase A-like [Mya arenaria]|uniref:peptidyl-glycine alpha-amidating monooxygenase A-like n=1 Tax=Mya arenaria TaxID=6604 RepID=UPI0022E2F366|nr:peptidyl-glycine alpha-amidating monooxygenase A-like [Mya arenaria]